MLMAYISPRRVIQSAPLRMRVQFWGLVASGIALASVTVSARGEQGMPVPWTAYWPMFLAALTWVFSAGVVWANFNSFKLRIEALEASAVRKDKLDDKLETIHAKLDGIERLIESNRHDWRDALHGSKE